MKKFCSREEINFCPVENDQQARTEEQWFSQAFSIAGVSVSNMDRFSSDTKLKKLLLQNVDLEE